MLYTISNGTYTAQVDSLGAQLVSLKGPDALGVHLDRRPRLLDGPRPGAVPHGGGPAGRPGENRRGLAPDGPPRLCPPPGVRLGGAGGGPPGAAAGGPTPPRWKPTPSPAPLTVAYTLTENGYETAFTVENTGDKPMPYAIGGHPGFNIPVDEQAAFDDYVIRFEKEETQRCPGIVGDKLLDYSQITLELEGEREIPLRHELFARDALIFENLNSHTVALMNPATGKGVEMEFSQFPLLGIWSAQNNGPYVCLEPWTGCGTLATEGDVFEQKKGMRTLAPSGKESYAFTIRFL